MPSSHTTIPTPAPRERSLIVQVEESAIANNPDIFPAWGTRYEECDKAIIAKDYPKSKWGSYIYVEQRGEHGMLFVKSKTPEQRNTLIKPKYQITDRVMWDAVLEWIEFGKETGFPLSQNTINSQGKQAIVTAERWLVPRGYRPSQSLNTIITVEEYLSEVPWPDWAMESDEPQPTEVMWDLVGSNGSMGKCLHAEVPVPAQASSGYRVVSVVGDKTQSGNSTAPGKFLFPKTNHKKRQDFHINVVAYIDGQYLRKRMTFHVPIPMSKIVQQS